MCDQGVDDLVEHGVPVDAHHGDVGDRVTDRGELPVHDGRHRRRTPSLAPSLTCSAGDGQQRVVDPVVTVDHAGRLLTWQPVAQGGDELLSMMDEAMKKPDEPIAMCIVDAAGNLEAYAKMDNLRIFSRRHAQRKAYTSAVMGMDSGAHAERLHGGGRNIADLGDPMMTHGQGGLVIMKDGVILGGIGVGGYPSGQADEDISRVGLNAMKL